MQELVDDIWLHFKDWDKIKPFLIKDDKVFDYIDPDIYMVALNVKMDGNVGHSVVMQSVVEKTVTKVNGTVTQKLIYYVMNPANGGSISRIAGSRITDAYRIFYIFP